MSRGDIILRLVDVEKVYETKEGRRIVALNKVTTSFKRGEFVAIVGKSGSGKSTLINILGGLDIPDAGDYFLEGNNIIKINEGQWDAIRNEKIGFIFQEYHLIEYLSVYKNVEIALKYQKGLNKKAREAKIRQILDEVGLIDHIHKTPGQLSGGQRQRVAIARALVKDPAIILADEPTGALDYKTSESVIELIKGLSKERLVIVVTHDRGIANNHATRIIELTEGQFTSDLIKESIDQTYQNVYRKTEPVNLSFRDKLELTSHKIFSRIFRTFFTALSLALAFSFTILFSGVERGITDSFDAYYEALNKANSYAFSLVPEDDVITIDTYDEAHQDLLQAFQNTFGDIDSEIIEGNSIDIAGNDILGNVMRVTSVDFRPDLLLDNKVRLYDVSNQTKYSYNELFIGESYYSSSYDSVMVTSKFMREYFELSDDVITLNEYVGTVINIPEYHLFIDIGIYNVEEYLDSMVELESGLFMRKSQVALLEEEPIYSDIKYLELKVPKYCYNYEDINEYYQGVCRNIIDEDKYSKYFDTVDDFILYMDDFKTQVNNIDPDYFDRLFRSNAIYYLTDEKDIYLGEDDPRYIERVYQLIYDETSNANGLSYFEYGVFRDTLDTREMTITAIIENENESMLYLDYKTYDTLFSPDADVTVLKGYYSINLEGGINHSQTPEDITNEFFVTPLIAFNREDDYSDTFKIIRNEPIEQGDECAIYAVDNVVNENSEFEQLTIVGDIFTMTDYSGCKVNSDSYHYLNSIRILFGVFFNVLMIISIVFFNILLQVILGERINEIGIYRSVGSTAKDIKRLFFIEIVFEIVLAAILSVVIIYFANDAINTIFLSVIDQGSGVINFAGMKLSIGNDQTITNISFFNLAFYILIVFALLGFLSNRNVSKLANTKPIDILREVD